MPRGALIDGIERGPFLKRLWYLHGRLVLAAVVGGAVFASSLTLPMRTPTRILVSWDTAIAGYLFLALQMMRRASVARIRQRAGIYDEGAFIVLTATTVAALASLIAVFAELGHASSPHHPYGWLDAVLGIGTIILSWAFMHTTFALRYAHQFYGEGRDNQTGGLIFPGDGDPDYRDFIYYSLVIAMTAQVSDVQVESAAIRRLTTLHGIVSFFFNIAVLALAINVISNLLQAGG